MCDLSDISIVVLSYNRRDILERNLPSLLIMVEEADCELIVVDNASADGSSLLIAERLMGRSGTQFKLNDKNLGVSEGRNVGWRCATKKYILSIDDDISVSPQAIKLMLAAMKRDPKIGIVSPDIVDSLSKRVINGDSESRSGAYSFYEACFLVSRSLIECIGCLDSNLMVAGEGLDFSLRLRKGGYIIKRISAAKVLHEDRIRDGTETSDRRKKWLWSFCYVYWKNMGALRASVKSTKIFLSHARSGFRLFGMFYVASLLSVALAGAYTGRMAK